MPFHLNDGGTWKEPEFWLNDQGTWKRPEVWVNDNGVWKLVAAPVTLTITLNPDFQNLIGTTTARNFLATTANVTGGTATAFVWGFSSASAGSFTIASGQGTATAIPRVSNVLPGSLATATLFCDVTVGGQVYRRTAPLSYESAGDFRG